MTGDNHRALGKIIDEMREITRKLILETPETAPISRRRNHPKAALSWRHSHLIPSRLLHVERHAP